MFITTIIISLLLEMKNNKKAIYSYVAVLNYFTQRIQVQSRSSLKLHTHLKHLEYF